MSATLVALLFFCVCLVLPGGELWGPAGTCGDLRGPAGTWGPAGTCGDLRGPAGTCGDLGWSGRTFRHVFEFALLGVNSLIFFRI